MAQDATSEPFGQEKSPSTIATGPLAAAKPRKAKKGRLRHLQWVLLLVLAGAIFYSFQRNVLSKSIAVPMQIGQLERQYQYETDQQAIPQIRQLYGTDMPIDAAFVSHYKDAKTQLNLWVGEAPPGDVMKMLENFTKKVESGEDKNYTDFKKLDMGGTTVYSIKREQEPQFYYQNGKRFVWIAIQGDNSNASQLLVDAMRAATGSHDGM